jgi:hypothetical protein
MRPPNMDSSERVRSAWRPRAFGASPVFENGQSLVTGSGRSRRACRQPQLRRLLAVAGVLAGLSIPTAAAAQTSTLYDFDTDDQLTNLFHGVGAGTGSVTQATNGGLGDTGSITVPLSNVSAAFTSKQGYSLGPIGSTYTFSTFLKSEGNSGHSGVGFASASPATASPVVAFRPDDALGVSVHGAGFVFHNGGSSISGRWDGVGNPASIETIQVGCLALLNECSPTSPYAPLLRNPWFKIVLIIERVSATEFDMTVEVWPIDVAGTSPTLGAADVLSSRFPARGAAFAMRGLTNSTVLAAPQLFSYFSFSGTRVTRFDDFAVSLSGGATVVEPGAPVVITENVAIIGNPTAALAGRVSAAGGTGVPVIERGFVYSTSPGPNLADTKVVMGSGTGEFSGTTALPASGTYYFRSFATNPTATSFGDERMVVYVASGDSGLGGTPATMSVGPALACSPDPVPEGARVTCEVTGGDADIDILWTARIGGAAFDGRGVTLGPDGNGRFTFRAPVGSIGSSIHVDLVEWTQSMTLNVVSNPVPLSVRAGEGTLPAPLDLRLTGLAVLLGAVLVGRRLVTAG